MGNFEHTSFAVRPFGTILHNPAHLGTFEHNLGTVEDIIVLLAPLGTFKRNYETILLNFVQLGTF